MALVVEDGTAKADADSYVSLADAATYATDYGLSFSGTDSEKEIALRRATQYVDAMFGERFKGYRVQSTQSLEWPRSGADDGDHAIDSNLVPQKVKDAVVELAVKARSETLAPDVAQPGELTEDTTKIGSLTFTKKWADTAGAGDLKQYTLVEGLLRQFLRLHGEIELGL